MGRECAPTKVVDQSFSWMSGTIFWGVPFRALFQAKKTHVPTGELISWSRATLLMMATGCLGVFGMMACARVSTPQ